jgi:hypothetical protein
MTVPTRLILIFALLIARPCWAADDRIYFEVDPSASSESAQTLAAGLKEELLTATLVLAESTVKNNTRPSVKLIEFKDQDRPLLNGEIVFFIRIQEPAPKSFEMTMKAVRISSSVDRVLENFLPASIPLKSFLPGFQIQITDSLLIKQLKFVVTKEMSEFLSRQRIQSEVKSKPLLKQPQKK